MPPSFLLPLLLGCGPEVAEVQPVAVQRLRQHILDDRRPVMTEALGTEVLWSDGAILERTPVVPAPIQALIDGTGPPAITDKLAVFLADLERRRAEWRPATVDRSGIGDFDCSIGDPVGIVKVNCIYVSYLEVRYPGGAFAVKGARDPLLFLDHDQVRGALMGLAP
jgi:hypothetical protein